MGADACERFIEAGELGRRGFAVSFVGCVEVGHHGFEAQRRAWGEAREERGQIVEGRALAAHAGVDFEMDGHGRGRQAVGAGEVLELVEMPGLPDNGREPVLEDGTRLAGENSGDDEDARFGTDGAGSYTFFHAGDAEPAGPGADGRGGAEVKAVAVG